jgi:hypothetical protein
MDAIDSAEVLLPVFEIGPDTTISPKRMIGFNGEYERE